MPKILDLVGRTPLVELQSIGRKKGVQAYAKLEGRNPGGSVKDRAAYSMIASAIKRGDLKKGMKLIEATSGNTGIALALISAKMGFEIELVIPEDASPERIKTMRAYGAKVILSPKEDSMLGARDLADEKAKSGEYYMLNQFANPDNPKAHYEGTGPEIWQDTDGQVTHFISAMGTTGTIMGTSKYLKEKNNGIKIIGAQPTDGSRIPGIRRWPAEYLPKIYDPKRVDEVIDISEQAARAMTLRLAREEGIFCGMSSGGAAVILDQIAQTIDDGVLVCIICDIGDRYLGSDLFD